MLRGILYAKQCALNATLPDYGKVGRNEKAAHRRANEAERQFRIEKGYEKDSVWTWIKYRFFKC